VNRGGSREQKAGAGWHGGGGGEKGEGLSAMRAFYRRAMQGRQRRGGSTMVWTLGVG
jgi:hypothetical protein